ncbi:MAG: DNRLRE domain-containing protein, partial [Dehalococcoidia bacterium]
MAVALTASLLTAPSAVADPAGGQASQGVPWKSELPRRDLNQPASTDPVTERADVQSALVSAKAQNTPVEVGGWRSSMRRMWVNPDGSYRLEMTTGPARVIRSDGTYADIDTTLTLLDDGRVRPKVGGVDLSLSAGGVVDPATGLTPLATVRVPADAASLDAYVRAQRNPSRLEQAPVVDKVAGEGAGFVLGWPGPLPAPVLNGSEATYREVQPGVDLRVRALPTGLETFVDLTRKPDVVPAEGVTINLPVVGQGLSLAAADNGAFNVVDGRNRPVATGSKALVWDARTDQATGEPTNVLATNARVGKTSSVLPGLNLPTTASPSAAAIPATPEQSSPSAAPSGAGTPTPSESASSSEPGSPSASASPTGSGPASAPAAASPSVSSPGAAAPSADNSGSAASADLAKINRASSVSLGVTVPASYLNDVATVYPVTIDPTFNFVNPQDSFARQDAPTTNYKDDPSLHVGSNGANSERIAYLAFPINKDPSSAADLGFYSAYTVINSATLQLYQFDGPASGCATSEMVIRAIQDDWFATNVNWNNRPGLTNTTYGSATDQHRAGGGGAGCGPGTIGGSGISVTGVVQYWHDHASDGNDGLALKSSEPTFARSFRKINSANAGSNRPTLVVDFRHDPKGATPPTAGGIASGDEGYANTTNGLGLSATVFDEDNSVRAEFAIYNDTGSTQLWTGSSGYVPDAQKAATVVPSGTFTDGQTYLAVARAGDGTTSTAYSAPTVVHVDNTDPSGVTVSCTGLTNNGWASRPTAAVPCTFSATDTGGIASFAWTLDGVPQAPAVATSNTATVNLPFPIADGEHPLAVQAIDKANNKADMSVRLGISGASLSNATRPLNTSSMVPINASAPTAWGGALQLQYFDATLTPTPDWVPVPSGDILTAAGGAGGNPIALTGDATTVKSDAVLWNAAATFASSGSSHPFDQVVRIRGCQLTDTSDTICNGLYTAETSFTFDWTGTGAATTAAGPVTVALTTGDASVSATDASLPTYAGALSLGRTYHSRSYDVDGIFGKGWATALPAATASGWTRLTEAGDNVIVYGPLGTPFGFTRSSSSGTYPTSYTSDYEGVNLTLTKTSASGFTVTDTTSADATTFTIVAGSHAGTPADPYSYSVATSTSSGAGATNYAYDGSGHLLRAIAPVPPSITNVSTSCPDGSTSSWAAGCTDLKLSYDGSNHVTKITLRTYDTSTSATVSTDVACFSYDGNGRMTTTWDPREGGSCSTPNALATTYGYDGTGRLATITPPGLAAWHVTYGTTGAAANRVASVYRQHTGGSFGTGTETTSLVWAANMGAASSGSDDSHPDLTATATATWGQATPPLTSVAVFPAAYASSTSDLRGATVYGLDALGDTVNSAVYSGAGQAGWKITTSQHDSFGNVVRTLSAYNRDRALNVNSWYTDVLNSSGLSAASTADRAKALDTQNVYSADGLDLLTSFGPYEYLQHQDGSQGWARAYTKNEYGDVNYPTTTPSGSDWTTKAPQHSVLKTTTTASKSPTSAPTDLDTAATRETRYAYALGAASTAAEKAGWEQRTAMRTTTEMGATDIVAEKTLFVAATSTGTAMTTETRQPSAAGTSADPGTRVVTYYKSGTQNVSTCTSDAWFGLPCTTGPGAQPGSGNPLPTTTTVYDLQRRATLATESVGSGTDRTTTTTYLNSGLSSRVSTVDVAGGVGADVPTKTTTYSSSTGLPLTVTDGTTTQTTGYDDFGRIVSFADGADGLTETTFDGAGRVVTVEMSEDGYTGRTTDFHYDEALPTGGVERRGLVTSQDHDTLGMTATMEGGWTPDGGLWWQSYPGGLYQENFYNTDGQQLSTTYSMGSTTWLDDYVVTDVHNQWRWETGTGLPAGHQYEYDAAGRLTQS